MNPHFKMSYYKDNNFENKYIQLYKQQIKKLWKDEYISGQNERNYQSIDSLDNVHSNALMAYIFKKRKLIQNDELDTYLNSEPINFNANILTFWKVKILIFSTLLNI